MRNVARKLYLVLIVCLLGYWAFDSRDLVFELYSQAMLSHLLVSALLILLAHFLSPLIVSKSFAYFIGPISYGDSLRIHISRLPHKYLPGGVWNTVARASDYAAFGFSAKALVKYFLVENLLIVGVTFFLGGTMIATLYTGSRWVPIGSVVAMFGAALLIFSAFNPKLRSEQRKAPPLSGILEPVIYSMIYWLLLGCSFLLFIKAFPGLQLAVTNLQVLATFIFSWAIGYIAIFAPQGVGVSEFVTSQLMASSLNEQEMMAFLVGFRFIVFFVDNFCFLLAYLLRLFTEKNGVGNDA